MALAKPKPAFTSARRLATKCACFSDSASSLSAAKARSKGRPLPTRLANCRVQTAKELAEKLRLEPMLYCQMLRLSELPGAKACTLKGTKDCARS